jgi:hypothetical protein
MLTLLKSSYADFKPTFATEKLSELHGISRSPETIRQLMLSEGLWELRRADPIHRTWRERRAALGELVQFSAGNERAWH